MRRQNKYIIIHAQSLLCGLNDSILMIIEHRKIKQQDLSSTTKTVAQFNRKNLCRKIQRKLAVFVMVYNCNTSTSVLRCDDMWGISGQAVMAKCFHARVDKPLNHYKVLIQLSHAHHDIL